MQYLSHFTRFHNMFMTYKYGGNDMSGVDCSGFVCAIFEKVYHASLPRTTSLQFQKREPITIPNLRNGDLVFFDIQGKGVSHVGIYIGKGKFVHASSSKGVVISDLSNAYYKERCIGGGRFPLNIKIK